MDMLSIQQQFTTIEYYSDGEMLTNDAPAESKSSGRYRMVITKVTLCR